MVVSGSESLAALLGDDLSDSASEDGIDLGVVGGVSDDVGEGSSEFGLGELGHDVELLVELLLVGLGALGVDLDGVEAELGEDLLGGLEVGVVLEVGELAELGVDVLGEDGLVGGADESLESLDVVVGDLAELEELADSGVESVVSVVLPDSSEVGLGGGCLSGLVGEGELVLLDDLRGELGECLDLLLELGSALGGGGVDAEDELVVLVSVGEGEDLLLGVVEVAAVSEPVGLGHFVVEEPGGGTLAPLLESEPLDDVGLLSLSGELHRGPL